MTLGNILVHVDSTDRAAARVALSANIAARVGATITGVFAEKADPHQVGAVAIWPTSHYNEALNDAHGVFAAATGGIADRAGFFDLNRGSDLEIGRRFVEIARTFDLVVLGQTHSSEPVPARLPEQTIYESGRPVLVVPYAGTFTDIGARPLFAWNSSRGAARALFDVLPLLTKGCEALIAEVARKSEQRDEFAERLIANLANHNVSAQYQHFVVDEINVMDALLSIASDHAADLIAIGAFDQGTQSVFGHGVGTRYILGHMTAPVLFSH